MPGDVNCFAYLFVYHIVESWCVGISFNRISPTRRCVVTYLWVSLIFICIINMYIPHHFILLRLNPFELSVDRAGWWFEHSVL